MKRSIPSLLVLGLLAALLVSCGQSATVQRAVATPTAASHTHTGRIAWQGFLDPNQTTAAIFSANQTGGIRTAFPSGHRTAPKSSSRV